MRTAMANLTLGALMLASASLPARAEVIEVKIKDVAFVPGEVSAHVGDTIEWVNTDFVAHTATARNGAWNVLIGPNAKKSIVLKSKGPVDYYCKFHPGMTGRIMVAD